MSFEHFITSINRQKFGWTKWGGQNSPIYKSDTWYCQVCAKEVSSDLPSWFIMIDDNEYARICSPCMHYAIVHDIFTFEDLNDAIRVTHDF